MNFWWTFLVKFFGELLWRTFGVKFYSKLYGGTFLCTFWGNFSGELLGELFEWFSGDLFWWTLLVNFFCEVFGWIFWVNFIGELFGRTFLAIFYGEIFYNLLSFFEYEMTFVQDVKIRKNKFVLWFNIYLSGPMLFPHLSCPRQ